MSNVLKKYLFAPLALLVLTYLSACAPGFDANQNQDESNKTRLRAAGSAEEMSEILTDEGELLLNSFSFSEAYARFNEAVQLNPGNTRAIFQSHSLRVILQFKGIAKRVKPLYLRSPYGRTQYDALAVALRQADESQTSSKFYFDGPEDIHTPDEFQEWMDQLNATMDDLKATIQKIKSKEITIRLPRVLLSDSPVQGSGFGYSDCSPVNFGPVRYEPYDHSCEHGKNTTVGLNRADFEGIHFGLSMFQVYLEILTTYRIDPSALFIFDSQSNGSGRSQSNWLLKTLVPGNAFGLLRKEAPLKGWQKVTSDLAAGFRYVIENQDELCTMGPTGSIALRRGYLFSNGYCIRRYYSGDSAAVSDEARTLRTLEMILNGNPVEIQRTVRGATTVAQLSPSRFMESPLRDLKELYPIEFNNCGQVTKFNFTPIKGYIDSSALEILESSIRSPECDLGNESTQ